MLPEGEGSTALHVSHCAGCGTNIVYGDRIRLSHARGWMHAACYDVARPDLVNQRIAAVNEKVEDVLWRIDELYERVGRLEQAEDRRQ